MRYSILHRTDDLETPYEVARFNSFAAASWFIRAYKQPGIMWLRVNEYEGSGNNVVNLNTYRGSP